jgi:ABC-type sulfate/molybdate transport systems ATPase subunit
VLLDRARRIDLPPEDRRVGYVFQEYALFPHMTVRQNVAFAGPARADEMLERFGITHLSGARPGALSGGERQRVGLARALAGEPEVLLFDEPLSALDAHTRDRVREELAGLLGRLALPALLVTHDFADATALADRIGVMSQGRVLQMGTPSEVLREPADAFVARFAGSNVLAGTARRDGDGLEVVLEGGAAIRAPRGPEGAVGAVVHPWDVAVVAGDAVPDGHNRIRAPIASVAPDGDRVRVRVGPLVAVVEAEAAAAMGLVPGRVATAAWAPERTRLVPVSPAR